MFGLFRRPAPRPLTDAIRRAIEKDGMTESVSNPSLLRMVESKGRYSDRKVTYFRVFDSTSPTQRSLNLRRYQDFDVFSGLVLRSGHVERDGTVVLTRPVIVRAAETPIQTQADRTRHADDAPIVRGETGASGSPSVIATSVTGQAP
ncbi:MAG TPA: hypothetical protein VFH48_16430 [Chloroflexota bacterium]|nr:hypothetical protein [Chloroflexota bacterium]